MASETTMRGALQKLAQSFRAYALAQRWRPEDYRVFVRPSEEWGQIDVILVARAFAGKHAEDKWLHVLDFLDKELKGDAALRDALHLTVRTFDEVAEGGLYAIGPGFSDINEFASGQALGRN